MKKSSIKLGSLGVAGIVLVSQASTVAFADEVAKNNVELKSTELDKQLEEFKKLGIEPTVEKQVIKKTVKSQDELEKARQEIEDKIHQADKANQSALDTTKTHKENVLKQRKTKSKLNFHYSLKKTEFVFMVNSMKLEKVHKITTKILTYFLMSIQTTKVRLMEFT